jgi:hypothetical protein
VLNPRRADYSGELIQLILLALSCVLYHRFAWYSGLVVPFLFPSRNSLALYGEMTNSGGYMKKNISANIRQIRWTSSRPSAFALRAFVNCKLRATHNTAIL